MSAHKKFEKGSVIFREGDYEQCMYRVLSGCVGIYRSYDSERRTLLTELEEGRIFGELGLIDYMSRSATAVALTDTETEVIGQDEFADYLQTHTEEAYAILNSVADRLRVLTADYEQVCRDLTAYAQKEGLNIEPSLMERIRRFAGFGKKYSER